ncbi:ras-GEF domain-containing family member 1C-like [Anguilla rostrata]|uniref:ras-GEF domain-containing family member 1C-like n=1 Tax=Anguilla anguilla TaxID=7936 RepID=UPI0015AEA015|nr:ras-GEF domain-containing family member 1C-like [Anguilla anguilla]
MPQTLCSSTMFTPSGFSPHLVPSEDPQGEGPGPGPGPELAEGPLLTSASLDTLIQHLVPTADYYPEKAYVFTFLLSSRLFIAPPELLSRVCQLCIKQQQLDQIPLDMAKVRKFGPKILQLLTEWTETFPSDFREEQMVGHLKDIIHRIAPCDEAYWKTMNQILQNLSQKLAAMSQSEEGLVKFNVSSSASDKMVAYKTKPSPIQKDVLSICSDPYTLAQQLTHVELERLSHIGPEEFVQAFAQKDPLDSSQPCFSDQKKKTSNLEAYVKWFNRLCYLVATEICMPAKKKQRALVIEFFIDVARECFNIGNFNSLMAIISGMNMSPVSRLKKTWGKVKTAKFFILEHQMDPTGNFYNYRTALRGAAHRSQTAHSNREKIVIPFFSLLIKDIYFLNEGCANRLPNGHVNFEKFVELARQVGEFMAWKQVECPFEEERNILHYLHSAPIFTEDGLYLASYESESPENQVEKDRWKALRTSILGKT